MSQTVLPRRQPTAPLKSFPARFRARVVNPFLRAMLRSPAHRMLSGSVLLIEYAGLRSGRRFRLPLMYASTVDDLLVVAGGPAKKTWWRNFGADPQSVLVTLRGRRSAYCARRLTPGTGERDQAVQAYRRRFPRVDVSPASPVIALRSSEPDSDRT